MEEQSTNESNSKLVGVLHINLLLELTNQLMSKLPKSKFCIMTLTIDLTSQLAKN